jgi:hypothetical protein
LHAQRPGVRIWTPGPTPTGSYHTAPHSLAHS